MNVTTQMHRVGSQFLLLDAESTPHDKSREGTCSLQPTEQTMLRSCHGPPPKERADSVPILQRPLHLDHHQQRQLQTLSGVDLTIFFSPQSWQRYWREEENCCQSCCPQWLVGTPQLPLNGLEALDNALQCIQADLNRRNIAIRLHSIDQTEQLEHLSYPNHTDSQHPLHWSKVVEHTCDQHTRRLQQSWDEEQSSQRKPQIFLCLINGADASSCSYAPRKIETILQHQAQIIHKLRGEFREHFCQQPPAWLKPSNCIIVVFNPQSQWIQLLERYYNAFEQYSSSNHLVSWHTRSSFANLERSLIDAICSATTLQDKLIQVQKERPKFSDKTPSSSFYAQTNTIKNSPPRQIFRRHKHQTSK